MSISKISKRDCTICCSCINKCPKNCISLGYEWYGFYYPVINSNKCNGCNLCEEVCPIINYNSHYSYKEIFAVKNKDESTRLNSSSGGVFYTLGKYILSLEGIVFGCKFDSNNSAICSYTKKLKDLEKFQKSKYVQIDNNLSYVSVKNFLDNGNNVLFSGCPCQIAGLKSYLNNEYDKLYTMDFICHGSPSPIVFRDYLSLIEKKEKSKIIKINFRSKSQGWKDFNISIFLENDKVLSEVFYDNLFMRGHLQNYYEKESCHACKFKKLNSGSDITVGDFWGVDELYPDFDDDKGVSVIIINSEKGMNFFNSVRKNFDLISISINDVLKRNPYLYESAPVNPNKDAFFKSYYKYGLNKAFDKYLKDNVLVRIKRRIKKYLINR